MKLFRRVFTLEHLKANKLRYLHNGNEDIVDSFVFEMEIKVAILTIKQKDKRNQVFDDNNHTTSDPDGINNPGT